MRYSDQWFFERLVENKVPVLAQQAFHYIHGSDKKPEISLEILNKNLDEESIKRCRKALESLDSVVDKQFADLIKYCAVTYANFCDEIYAGLDDFYFQSIMMEWLLHSESSYAQRRYRDHLTHQLKVTLLGIEFLDGKIGGNAPLMPHIVKALKICKPLGQFLQKEGISENIITDDLVFAAWLLCGMFHDIGYCFVMHIKTAKKLAGVSGFFNYNVVEEIWQKVESRISEHSYITEFYRTHGAALTSSSSLEEVKMVIKSSAFEGRNHSVIGALYLIYMLDQIESRAAESFKADNEFKGKMRLIFELAALAVLTHDIDSPSKQSNEDGSERYFKDNLSINFDDYPLSYLLGISDQLQDWGRRRVVREPTEGGICIERSVVDSTLLDLNLTDESLVIRFHANTPSLEMVEPSYWFFGKKVQLGSISTKSTDEKALLNAYPEGRAYILSSIYGPCPLWKKYSLFVDAGGATFSPADYFKEVEAKQIFI